MATIKLMVWNMEWMNDLFTSNGDYRPPTEKPLHMKDATVLLRRRHLSKVINELLPDVLVVVEGPTVTAELQLFFDTDVTGTWQCHIQEGSGTQRIGIAIRTDTGKFAANPFTAFDTRNIAAFNEWRYDLENDNVLEVFKFERYPLYAALHGADGTECRILGLHLKSKLVASAMEWSKWWTNADANRKKILAQAIRIRTAFLDTYLDEAQTANIPLIVCGDVNDGPGMDASEKRLLGSGIEKLMGEVWFPTRTLGNALFDSLKIADQNNLRFEKLFTTSFADPIFNGTYHREWIDHILYTRNKPGWVKDAKVHIELAEGKLWEAPYKFSSDHHPIEAILHL